MDELFKHYNKLSISANFASLILSCVQLYGCIVWVDNMSVLAFFSLSKTYNKIKDKFVADKSPTVMGSITESITDLVSKKH